MFVRARVRLMLLQGGVLLAILLVLGVVTFVLMDRLLIAQETASLQSSTADVNRDLRNVNDPGFRKRHLGYDEGAFVVLWSRSGTVLYNPAHVDVTALRAAARSALQGHSATAAIQLSGTQDALVDSQPVAADRGGGAVQVGRSLAAVRDVEREAAIVIGVASAGAILLSLLGGWFLAGRALSPIRDTLQRQQEFTADASHELRTPLAVLDSGIQLMQRRPQATVADNAELLDSMRDEAMRMRRLVESLLALARADAGQAAIRPAPVDVGALVRTVARDLGPDRERT
ncbi:MAG: histidine kinase dimerization/phospho-acceptor domain-containing protein [Candidatus Dormiibacterota bacterium]